MELDIKAVPNNLEEAVDTLMAFYAKDLPTVRTMSEKEFRGSAHYAAGMFIRSSWYLWWYNGHPYEHWSSEKPALVQWFQDREISHPDDMSDEILRAFWEKVRE